MTFQHRQRSPALFVVLVLCPLKCFVYTFGSLKPLRPHTEMRSTALEEAPSEAIEEAPSNAIEEAPSNAMEEAPSKVKVDMDDFRKGQNFLKVLVNFENLGNKEFKQRKIGTTQLVLAPNGHYFPFAPIGTKVLMMSGDQVDILATLKVYSPPGKNNDTLIRLLIPKVPISPFLGEGKERLEALKQSLKKFTFQKNYPINEEVVEILGESSTVFEAVKWILSVVNTEPLREEMKTRLTAISQDSRHGIGESTKILIPFTSEEASYFIGKGGKGLSQLKERFRVNVYVAPFKEQQDKQTMVTLSGPVGAVHQAHLQLMSLSRKMKAKKGVTEADDSE